MCITYEDILVSWATRSKKWILFFHQQVVCWKIKKHPKPYREHCPLKLKKRKIWYVGIPTGISALIETFIFICMNNIKIESLSYMWYGKQKGIMQVEDRFYSPDENKKQNFSFLPLSYFLANEHATSYRLEGIACRILKMKTSNKPIWCISEAAVWQSDWVWL